jgi:hypothetical protein
MRLLRLVAICTFVALGQTQHETESRTGWISDEACGANHAKSGRADCVEKCWRGGASIGHPEWKPQRAVFVADGDHAVWVVLNQEAVKKFPAAHVELAGKFDSKKKTVLAEAVTSKEQ